MRENQRVLLPFCLLPFALLPFAFCLLPLSFVICHLSRPCPESVHSPVSGRLSCGEALGNRNWYEIGCAAGRCPDYERSDSEDREPAGGISDPGAWAADEAGPEGFEPECAPGRSVRFSGAQWGG